MEKWRRIIHSSSAPTRCGHIHQNYITKEKCNEKERKEEQDHVLKKMEIKWTRGGCLLQRTKGEGILEHVPSLFFFYLPHGPSFHFLSAEAIHLYTCQLQQLAPPVEMAGVWPDERLAGHGQPQATQAKNWKNNGLPMEPSHWSGYHFPPFRLLFNIQVNSNSQLAHPLIGPRGLRPEHLKSAAGSKLHFSAARTRLGTAV